MQDYAVHPHRPYVSTAAIDACYLFATREPLPGGSGLHTLADHVGHFEHTYAPCARSDLGSCSSADDGLARPSEAADAAERSERACRCYRRTGSSTLDGGGHQGVGCSCVAAVDVVR